MENEEEEFEVSYIDQPRFNGNTLTFNVHWVDGTCNREPIKHLIPGSVFLIEQWIEKNGSFVTEKLIKNILNAF